MSLEVRSSRLQAFVGIDPFDQAWSRRVEVFGKDRRKRDGVVRAVDEIGGDHDSHDAGVERHGVDDGR